MHYAMVILFMTLTSLPPAAKVLSVAGLVFAVMQAAKQSPWLTSYLKGWLAVAVNVALTVAGIVVVTPPDQLYTMATLQQILITVLTSAGVHGTVSKAVLPSLKG